MAEVFRAKSFGVEGFEKIIAVKRILPSMGEDQDFIDMFVDEAKIAGQLSHANICQIFELGKIDETHFIAMEFVWGKDLLQIQNRFRKLGQIMPLPMACFVIARVCEGLDYAHRKRDPLGVPLNLVHRDCSPQNILVSYEGEIKIIDFGIAKAASRSSKTVAGVLKGKFGYMSPEQVRGLALDRRSDLFAVGTMLYESITGERLFQTESDFSTLEKVRNVDIFPPSHFNRNIPRQLEDIVLRALARDPDDRYQHAGDMQAELQSFLMSQPEMYTPKQLGSWLKGAFSAERSREQNNLDRVNELGPDGSPRVAAVPAVIDRPGRGGGSDFDDGPTEIFGELDVENDPAVQEVLVAADAASAPPAPASAPASSPRSRPASIPPPMPAALSARYPMASDSGRHRARGTGMHPMPAPATGSSGDGVVAPVPTSESGRFGLTASVPAAPPSPAERRRAILRDVGIGLGIAAVVLLLVAAGKYLVSGGGAGAPQPPAALAGTIAVTVPDLEPADVLLNGKPAGSLESGQALTLGQLAPGSYSITVRRPGVPDCVKAVDLAAGRVEVVTCAMRRPSRTGELELEALPGGAAVFVNGQQISAAAAREPLVLQAGVAHEVEVRIGDELLRAIQVTVAPGERLRRSLALDAEQQARLQVALDDTSGGRGAEGDRKRARPAAAKDASSETARDTGSGAARPRVTALGSSERGRKSKGAEASSGEKGRETEAATEPPRGYLIAWTTPWARVFIDGKDTGKMTPIAPRARIALTPGTHKVTFVVGAERFSYSVDVAAGETLRLKKDLPVAD